MPAIQQQQQEKPQDLADLLRRAATADRTVLITAINEAWAAPGSFLESFRHGENIGHLVQHLLFVAMGKKALDRCNAVHPFCYWFTVDSMDFAADQSYMKGDYLEMMWRWNRFQQTILELGYDTLPLHDAPTFLHSLIRRGHAVVREPVPATAQLVMSTDFFVGDPNSVGNYPNGGLLYVKSGDIRN